MEEYLVPQYCCENCFNNLYIKEFVLSKNCIGDCNYCGSINVNIVSVEEIGQYFRECFDKAFESIEEGTGAMYDSEAKEYLVNQRYSVIDIVNEEMVFEDDTSDALLKDIIEESGPSFRDIKHGDYDSYGDIYEENFVIKNDLYGIYDTNMYSTWERFKFTVKHYNRFFDVDGVMMGIDERKTLLDNLRHFIMEYEECVPCNSIFYRARQDSSLNFDTISIDKELSPPPPNCAQTNRMSPAGISYLYLASSMETAYKECGYKSGEVIIAKYFSKAELQIVDFSKNVCIGQASIFSDDYDHDSRWYNDFLNKFAIEISKPVDKKKTDLTYEYTATQLIAEYIRALGFDGICFNSSTGTGKSYCFFYGPDLTYCKKEYGISDDEIDWYCTLPSFLDVFHINKISLYSLYENEKLNEEKSRYNS